MNNQNRNQNEFDKVISPRTNVNIVIGYGLNVPLIVLPTKATILTNPSLHQRYDVKSDL